MRQKAYTIIVLAYCLLLGGILHVNAQNGTANQVILQTNGGQQELSTDDIQVIRFDGPTVTIVQPWGNSTYSGTLQGLTFLRPLPGMLRLTVSAQIASDSNSPSHRALSIDEEGKLKSTWESDDMVLVYPDATSTNYIGYLEPETKGSTETRLTGEIWGTGLTDGQTLYLSTMPRDGFYSFAKQTGNLKNIFYATAMAEVIITGGNATISDATFQPAQAVTRFTLQDGSSNAVAAKKLVIEGGPETITVTIGTPTNEVYVAMPPTDAKTTYTFTATTDDNREWTGTKTANVQAGGYYRTSVTLTKVKFDPDVTAPTAKASLTYSGSAQELVDAGSTTGGTLQYKVGSGDYSIDIPTAIDAGTYTVYYKVVGGDDYNDVAEQSLEVTIGKADGAATFSPASVDFAGDTADIAVAVTGNTGTVSAASVTVGSGCSVSVSGSTITISRTTNSPFSAIITVTIDASANYNSTTKTINVSGTQVHVKGDVESVTMGDYKCAKLYTSATSGYYIMCTDYKTSVSFATAKTYSVTAGGQTFTCGTSTEWATIGNTCKPSGTYYEGYDNINSKCKGIITGWTEMDDHYWTSTDGDSSAFGIGVGIYYIGNESLSYNYRVRLISAF